MNLSQRRLAAPSLGGLLATRRGSLMLALVCALGAAIVLIFALGRYKASVQQPTPQATALVATGAIAKGTSGDLIAARRLYKSTPFTATQLSPGAIANAAQLAGVTAHTNILPGQQLTTADFSSLTGVDETLSPGQRAVALSIGESPGITDALLAGEHVDVYWVASSSGGSSSTGATGSSASSGSGGASTNGKLVLLDPDVEVIKPATPTPVTAGGQAITGSSMVLRLAKGQVAQTILADQTGSLYLSLRPPNATATPPVAPDLSALLRQSASG